MEITDFSKGQPWAILPGVLEKMTSTVQGMEKREDLSTQFAEFTSGRSSSKGISFLSDKVAVIQIAGPISKRRTFLSFLLGGTTTASLQKDLEEALEDSEVKAIVLDIDSPGGTIDGTRALSDLIFEIRKKKPVVAFANGLMASAAYWIGSAAGKIVAENTAQVGSIGVLATHVDYSGADRKRGVKRTILSSGKYKAMGNTTEPLSKEAKEVFQAQLDYFYTIFVDSVARNRGKNSQTVLEKMADGRVFIGQQAKVAGLVDRVGGMDVALQTALELAGEKRPVRQLTRESLSTTEMSRILALAKAQFGEEAGKKFGALIETGVSPEVFKFLSENSGQQPPSQTEEAQAMEKMLNGLKGANEQSKDYTGKDFLTLVREVQHQRRISRLDALMAVVKEFPEAHKAFVQDANPGKEIGW